ncbi:MAG TPA: oligosaccharide flippase family protein [Burkholderiales bacterium]|nr:oligosaccharide flippase family protein [Burkholderiales bacterium]
METVIDEAGPHRMIGRASIVAAGTVYQQGISFLAALIVARVIGASEYGIFNLARNLVDLTAIVTRLGLDIGLQRYFGETSAAQDHAFRIVVLRRVRLFASALSLLTVAAVALGLGRVLEANVYHYSQFAEILLCLALALPFFTDIAVLGGAYRGILKLSPPVMTECVLMPTVRLALILILFAAGWRLWAVVAGTTAASILASVFIAIRARDDFRARAPAPQDSWTNALRVVRYSSILAVAVLATTLTGSMDMLILGSFATAQDLGQYSLVKMLLVLMGVFGVAFTSGLGTLVAERHFRGDPAGVVQVMSVTARLVTLVTLPIFAIFLFWGAEIALLFGSSFSVSQAVVSWLATGQFVLMIFGPAGWALSMTGRHVLEVKILIAGLVLSALFCLVAVPALGQLGAAIATCCSITVVNLVRLLFVRRSIGVFPFGVDIFAITAAGIGLGWGSDLMVAQFALSAFWSIALGIGGFVLAYGVAGWMYFLSDAEKNGMVRALRDKVRKLSAAEQ